MLFKRAPQSNIIQKREMLGSYGYASIGKAHCYFFSKHCASSENVTNDQSSEISTAFQSVASHFGKRTAPLSIRTKKKEFEVGSCVDDPQISPMLQSSQHAAKPLSHSIVSRRAVSEREFSANHKIIDNMLVDRLNKLEKLESEVPRLSLASNAPASPDESSEMQLEDMRETRPFAKRKTSLLRCICRAGMVSLTHGTRIIQKGEVYINDKKVCDPFKEVSRNDFISISGNSGHLRFQGTKLWAFYKPRNMSCISSSRSPTDQPSIWRRLAMCFGHSHLIPIKPLHFEDRGLILLTNDGELAQYMNDPKVGLQRTYIAKVVPKIDPLLADKLTSNGLHLDGSIYRNVSIHVAHESLESNANYIRLCVRGKLPFKIFEVLEKLGRKASKITRLSMGPYSCKGMNPMKLSELSVLPSYMKYINPIWTDFIERDKPYFRQLRLRFLRHSAKYRPLSAKEAKEFDSCAMSEVLDMMNESVSTRPLDFGINAEGECFADETGESTVDSFNDQNSISSDISENHVIPLPKSSEDVLMF